VNKKQRIMKLVNSKILIVGIGAFLLMGTLFGQREIHNKRGDRPNRQNSERMLEKMSEELELSDEQKTEIKEILKSQKETKKEDRKAAREEVQAEILEVLTPEQAEAYNALKAEREERNAKRKEAHEAIKAFKEKNVEPFILQKRLELESILTEEEKASLATIRESKSGSKKVKGNRKGQKSSRQRLSKDDREVLQSISKKYAEDIDRLQGEIEGRQESWKKEIQAIRDAYKWEEGVDKKNDKREGKRDGRKEKHEKKGKKGLGKDARFLLMDIE